MQLRLHLIFIYLRSCLDESQVPLRKVFLALNLFNENDRISNAFESFMKFQQQPHKKSHGTSSSGFGYKQGNYICDDNLLVYPTFKSKLMHLVWWTIWTEALNAYYRLPTTESIMRVSIMPMEKSKMNTTRPSDRRPDDPRSSNFKSCVETGDSDQYPNPES